MYLPEYSITPKILKNISIIEYCKAIVENTTVLPLWEKQLRKDSTLKLLHFLLKRINSPVTTETIKQSVDGLLENEPTEIAYINKSLKRATELSIKQELNEEIIKNINTGPYRSKKVVGKINPEELLAETVQFFDWVNSRDAKDTHPIIVEAIIHFYLEKTQPFEKNNSTTTTLTTYLYKRMTNYDFKAYTYFEHYCLKNLNEYENELNKVSSEKDDLTHWVEYYTSGLSSETATLKEKIKLLAKDTKVAKATGRLKLTERQEKIVEYLQDYGILTNKEFSKLFPNTSEDTVLRQLKGLLDMGIVIKAGSTKSSRYELK